MPPQGRLLSKHKADSNWDVIKQGLPILMLNGLHVGKPAPTIAAISSIKPSLIKPSPTKSLMSIKGALIVYNSQVQIHQVKMISESLSTPLLSPMEMRG